MTKTVSDEVGALREGMSGKVLVQGDGDYDEARRLWNAEIDRKPAVIAQCVSAADVAAALRFATQRGLEVAVRGGAHMPAGHACGDGGLMIHLGAMNSVVVDPQARRARVGGGALLADVVAAAQEHGLAFPVGAVGHTGVGGLTLGGGMGWLSRKHGLSIDNMVSAEVVTADGRILRASDQENEDLFWAIRGGGGNFGVVTEFEFALHPVGPMIQVGLLFWPLDAGKDFLRRVRDVVGSLPPEVNVIFGGVNAPPAPFVPPVHQMQPGYIAVVAGFGSADDHQRVLSELRGLSPLWEFVTPMPYLALQTMLDDANAWGNYAYDKGGYLAELTDDVIDVIADQIPRKASPLSATLVYRLDGAFVNVADDATAFSGRRVPGYAIFIIALCPALEMLPAERDWVRRFYSALEPHMVAKTYVNALSGDESAERVRAAYGPEKYDRLALIKAKYDPDNVFRRNANIKPSVPAQRAGS